MDPSRLMIVIVAATGCVLIWGIQPSLAATTVGGNSGGGGGGVGTGKQLLGQNSNVNLVGGGGGGDYSTERGGWSYPTGYSWTSNAASFGLPLIIIPLIYFGFLWCVLLFGLSVFNVPHHGHHRPSHHGHHHRYRRYDDGYVEDDYTQRQILSSI